MMSTREQILSSALHGEALRRVDRPEIRALIAELAELAQGRDDVRTECAGSLAGSWFAEPASSYAEQLGRCWSAAAGWASRRRPDHRTRQGGLRTAAARCRVLR